MMVSIGEDEARALLQDERIRLQQIRASLTSESGDSITEEQALTELSYSDQHAADVGTETFERARDLSILEHIDAQLADVDHALERLDTGTYGTCEACGRVVDDDRLRARPATRYCIDDQARMEQTRP